MRTTMVGRAWSEDEGARAMAMTAAQDRWCRETAGRPNQGSEVSFCDCQSEVSLSDCRSFVDSRGRGPTCRRTDSRGGALYRRSRRNDGAMVLPFFFLLVAGYIERELSVYSKRAKIFCIVSVTSNL
jgi:hypothetical protein